jgi:hypothetical protein
LSVALSGASPDRRASALEGRVLDAGEQTLGAAAQSSRRPGIGSYPDRRRGGSAGRLILWGVQLCVRAFSGWQVLDGGRHIFRTRRGVRACLGRVVRVAGLRCVLFWARWDVRGRRGEGSLGAGVGHVLLLARRGVRVSVGGALSGNELVSLAVCWGTRAFPGCLAGGRCRCGRGARSVAPGALPVGCPGRLAAECPLAIADLDGHGYLSVALVACFLGLVGLPAGLVGLPAALLSLICLLAGFGRILSLEVVLFSSRVSSLESVVSSCRLACSLPSSSGPSNDVVNAVQIAISSTAPIPTRTYGVSSRLKVPPSHATPALD